VTLVYAQFIVADAKHAFVEHVEEEVKEKKKDRETYEVSHYGVYSPGCFSQAFCDYIIRFTLKKPKVAFSKTIWRRRLDPHKYDRNHVLMHGCSVLPCPKEEHL
jgi:hypothetical protein